NNLFEQGLLYSRIGSYSITDGYMTGYIRNYSVLTFGFFTVMGILMVMNTGLPIYFGTFAPDGIHEALLTRFMLIAPALILINSPRMVSIIILGSIVFSMALFFVFFRAPDLALTQLAIETVTTSLFLVCFYHLPKKSRHEERMRFKFTNFIVSFGVAVFVILIGLSAFSERLFESISEYHIENVYDLAAGGNMVNVILV